MLEASLKKVKSLYVIGHVATVPIGYVLVAPDGLALLVKRFYGDVGYREVAIPMFRLALETQKSSYGSN